MFFCVTFHIPYKNIIHREAGRRVSFAKGITGTSFYGRVDSLKEGKGVMEFRRVTCKDLVGVAGDLTNVAYGSEMRTWKEMGYGEWHVDGAEVAGEGEEVSHIKAGPPVTDLENHFCMTGGLISVCKIFDFRILPM